MDFYRNKLGSELFGRRHYLRKSTSVENILELNLTAFVNQVNQHQLIICSGLYYVMMLISLPRLT